MKLPNHCEPNHVGQHRRFSVVDILADAIVAYIARPKADTTEPAEKKPDETLPNSRQDRLSLPATDRSL